MVKSRRKLVLRFMMICLAVFLAAIPFTASAASTTTDAIPTNRPMIVPFAENPGLAGTLTIFASSSSTNSSIPSADGHAFIKIMNYKSGAITVGKLSGIGQYKSVSLGTWGNKGEHTGLWYNLESKLVSQGGYSDRVSLTMELTDAQLAGINNTIANSDSWANLNNCSSFAIKIWNSVSSTQLSNGTFNTPTALKSDIVSKGGVTGTSVPYDYLVYYANGTGAPIRSTQY